ncbi:DUF4360 domain-containing protein [Bdellovibrio sp. HCB337]|uniref:DUF4360 domain-containing protein n=1 Tax=Bdellovibrio sp. HCB337 TaxID=3394358 RepID=UPI0039A6A1C2
MLLPILMLLGSSLSASAQVPPGVQIQQIQARGNGCPDGSYAATIAPDGQSFSLLFDQYIAESTPQMTLDRKTCQMRIDFAVPTGWQYAVISADYRGFASVEAGAVATHQALYSFDGSKPPNERPGFQDGSSYSFKNQNFNGPFQDNYFIRNQIDPRIAPWSPCAARTQSLFVSTFLTARAVNWRLPAASIITLDTVDGQVQSQKYGLVWRKCSGVGPQPQPPGNTPPPTRPPNNPGRPPRFP